MRHHGTTDTENIPPLSTKVIKVGIKVTGLYQTRNVHTQKKKNYLHSSNKSLGQRAAELCLFIVASLSG